MRIKRLTIENYKSFRYKTRIDFPTSEEGNTVFLIGGMNGAGKSSLMDAINHCLYGCKNEYIFRSINRREMANNNTHVSFELVMDNDGSELIVRRSWKARTVDNPRPNDLAENLVVTQDGNKISTTGSEAWHEFLKAKIPDTITQFFFFDGEKIQEFASDSRLGQRLRVSLESALGIEHMNTLSEDLATLKRRTRSDFTPITDADIEHTQARIRKEQSRKETKEKRREEMLAELEEYQSRIEETRESFESIFHTEPKTKEAIRKNEFALSEKNARKTQMENDINRICVEYLPVSMMGVFFDKLKEQLEEERETLENEVIKQYAEELAKKMVVAVDEPEPIHEDALNEAQKTELFNRIYKLLQMGLTEKSVTKILNLSEADAGALQDQMNSIERSDVFLIPPMIEEKREVEQSIIQLKKNLYSGASSESEKQLFDELQQKLEGDSAQIGRIRGELQAIADEIHAIDKTIQNIESELNGLYSGYEQSKETEDFITECDNIMKLLKEYIDVLRKNKVALLAKNIFKMYNQLSNRREHIQDLSVDEKSYDVNIIDKNGHKIRKESLSAGEKEVFAISLLWGLAQTSKLKLPIIIDTPLSRLDSSHRENIVKHYFCNAGEQVIILSTDTEIDQQYYSMLKPYLSGAARLEYDKEQEMTVFSEGYFWED